MQFPTPPTPLPLQVPGGAAGGYFEALSGREIIVATPATQPALWSAYIDGARKSYRTHAVESAIEYGTVRDGRTTALFFALVETDGQVVGGLRVQGPLTHPDQAHALREWDGRPGTEQIRAQIRQRLAEGVIEIKAVWVDHDAPQHSALTSALARAFIHAMDLLGVRHAMCTAAGHAMSRWMSGGGVVSVDVAAVPYPDERYETKLLWWDRDQVAGLLSEETVGALRSESAQLFRHQSTPRAAIG